MPTFSEQSGPTLQSFKLLLLKEWYEERNWLLCMKLPETSLGLEDSSMWKEICSSSDSSFW